PRRQLRLRQRRPPQETVRNVRLKLGACLPAGREDPSPRGPFGEAGGPKGGAASKVDEHHHLFRAIRLPREYGWGRYTTSSHRPCHIKREALSRADRQWG